jgi:hypothetical protein
MTDFYIAAHAARFGGQKNDLYKRTQGKPRGLCATFGGLAERHTDGNGAHHTARRVGDRDGILTGVIKCVF